MNDVLQIRKQDEVLKRAVTVRLGVTGMVPDKSRHRVSKLRLRFAQMFPGRNQHHEIGKTDCINIVGSRKPLAARIDHNLSRRLQILAS